MIKSKLKMQPVVINLKDFYLPLRGNLRRKNSQSDDKESEDKITKEISEINRHYDFDNPSAIDWDLLIVRSFNYNICYRKESNY